MVWEYEKFIGNMAIYALCPKCGYYHNPSSLSRDKDGGWIQEILYQYNYCPMCGEYLYDEDGEENGFEVTWNERNFYDFLSEEG